ncbi:MAG: glycyl radical protein [Proteobacteria bacterium]|nr:glycyl radical protein [Pseudomonadota bacterium]
MNDRVKRLREQSLKSKPTISAERAELLTDFYKENQGKHSTPVQRALSFKYLCEHKTIYIGTDELIVGERGPAPKATPTYPELTCHSLEDLSLLSKREKTSYHVSSEVMGIYEGKIIPYWRGRNLRDLIMKAVSPKWVEAYKAGIFTEFMEQRAPGHTVADGKIYERGMLDFKEDIALALEKLDESIDPFAQHKRDQLKAMDIAAEAMILFARRHAELAQKMATNEPNPIRQKELKKISTNCLRVPKRAPRDLWEALQAYWFCHLAVITELNGWDSFSPGHLDQHLEPFFVKELDEGSLTRELAKELLQCFFIKFNNHPAPPKVGVTAEESGTYTDFANINLAGLKPDGADATNEVSYLLLEVIDEMHILQPSQNVQISKNTPNRFLKEACRVIRKGYGFPSVFNSDMVTKELVRQGKTLEDARQGGTSGCVESGAFGKEAYILTGYFNLPKLLELALNDGTDLRTGQVIGVTTGDPSGFKNSDDVFSAWQAQMHHFLDIKIQGNRIIEQIYAENMPAPFLSLITDDCIQKGLDYNEGGARYNTSYIQGVGIGTLTDSFAALRNLVFGRNVVSIPELRDALQSNFEGHERLQKMLQNKSPKWGNDDDEADDLMRAAFNAFFRAVDGKPNTNGGVHHINMLPTTCHIYFGSVTMATPDGRKAKAPLSEGISPVQGMDRNGPTAVVLSAAKMDHEKTGGTLLNMKFIPQVLEEETGLENLVSLIRAYFKLGGHHMQFNVISSDTLKQAQKDPDSLRNLIVRVAGYSDYFRDLSPALQNEIIARTEQSGLCPR